MRKAQSEIAISSHLLEQSPKPHHADGQRHGKAQVIAP